MDLETAQTTTTAKLPILKQGEYDMWRLRIEQYFQVQDYALWDVIENENSFKPAAQKTTNADGTSTTLISGLVTTEEKVQKKNDVKARSMLLMTLPNEHLMTFNQYKDAKTLFAAIQTRFGDTMSFDDLYNNFKIVKQEVKGTARSSSSSQNMAFVSSPNSTNEVNTAYGVNTANTQVALLALQVMPLLKITINGSDTTGYDKSKVECFNCHKMGHFAREYRGHKNQDSRNMNQDSSRRTINVEETSSKAMVAIDGAGYFYEQLAVPKRDISYKDSELSMLKSELEMLKQEKESNQLKIEKFDNASKSLDKLIESHITDKSRKGVGFVSYNAVPPPPTGLFSPLKFNLSNSGLEEESPDPPLVEKLVSNDKLEKKTVFLTIAKIEFVRPKQQEKPVRKPAKYAEMYRLTAITIKGKGWHQRERMESRNNYTRVNYNYSAKKTHLSAHRNMVPRAVLMKTGLKAVNNARPVPTAHPKTTVYSARP
ncbi:ribonuclease H-like domain-containing protein, partial [Tanacetum coccineum]